MRVGRIRCPECNKPLEDGETVMIKGPVIVHEHCFPAFASS